MAASFPTVAEQQATQIEEGKTVDASDWKLTDLDLLQTLGTGSYGRVRLCKHRNSGEYYAIKIMKKSDILRMKQVQHIVAEKNVLAEVAEKFHHPFIANLICSFQDEEKLYLILEFVVGGEIFTTLRNVGKFPNDVAKFYIAEIVLVFEYLHTKDIIYRDLKPENILLQDKGHIKLTDFGFAKKVPERTFTLCGTPEYLAPEVIQSKGHGKAVDWWTMGILLYEFIAGYPPFFDESTIRVYEKIIDGRLKFPAWCDARAKELISGLLTTDPTRRLGALKNGVADIKTHPYFSTCNWDKLYARYYNAPIPVKVKGPGDTSNFQEFAESDGNGAAGGAKAGGDQQNTLNSARGPGPSSVTTRPNTSVTSVPATASPLSEEEQAEFKDF